MAEKVARNGGGIEEFSMPWEGVKERKLWNKKIFLFLRLNRYLRGESQENSFEKKCKKVKRAFGVS